MNQRNIFNSCKKNEESNLIKLNKGDCRFCGNDCEGEHGFSDEKGFIDICDDCLNDILAKREIEEKKK